jgi:hypothetical protein
LFCFKFIQIHILLEQLFSRPQFFETMPGKQKKLQNPWQVQGQSRDRSNGLKNEFESVTYTVIYTS